MSTKEQVLEELERLSEAELKEVADYLAFLKYRSQSKPLVVNEAQLAALYAEFAEEDRELAEEGMADYAEGLRAEDNK
jgi:outer membrane protein assembly factor BamD (BamD/ComL family)